MAVVLVEFVAGLAGYHGRKPQYAEDDPRLLHAFKLYQNGMSDIDVSRNTGIKRTTFIRYRVKYGIKRK